MRTFKQLNTAEKATAEEKTLSELLTAILEGLRFNDELNNDDLQERIDSALEKADDMRTPWFAHEFLMEDPYVKEMLEGMAQIDAENCFYPDAHERVIRL